MDTREQIVQAAWKLFGERGFEDVSVRDVTNLAKVNLASVSYHFGNKAGLMQEIVKRILVPANDQRLKLLQAQVAKCSNITNVSLDDVLEAFLRPALLPEEHGSNTGIQCRLAARYLIDPEYDLPQEVVESYTQVFVNFGKVIYMKIPSLTPERIRERLLFCSGAAIQYQSFGGLAAGLTGESPCEDQEEILRDIVAFCSKGFTA